ncbi:MAG: glycosyltransferase, partial [Actinomycetota bacterium]|nr:glycosyltransferase [Actinomycetota bacterium]
MNGDEAAIPDGTQPQGLSIIVLTRGPSFALARLLRSLGRAEGVEQAELLIGLNGSGGEASVVERLVGRYLPQTRTRLVSVPKTSPAHARNLLIEEATEPLLLFLDDDVEVRGDLLSEAASTMTDDGLIAAGGPNLTPPRSPKFEQLAGRVLGSVIGTGPVRHRYRLGERGPGTERSLMLSNLVVRRSALSDERFNPDLFCAEENDLLARLARAGAWLSYNPKLSVHHHRRGTLSGHL